MFGTSLKNRIVWTLLILAVIVFLGLYILVRLFISKPPSNQFLVNNTWCSISPWVVKWMVDENESFAQQTVIFGDGYREKIMEVGNWHLITAQNGTVKVK